MRLCHPLATPLLGLLVSAYLHTVRLAIPEEPINIGLNVKI